MSNNYTQKKRVRSLATRYLHGYDSLAETEELNSVYHQEFVDFAEMLLADLYGLEKETAEKKIHRPRKVGSRPPKRTAGTRPPRIGQEITETAIAQKNATEQGSVSAKTPDDKPSWYKKAWRRVMMEVHPDRIDTVSKNELDKLERMKISSRLQVDKSDDLLIACALLLEVKIDLNIYEQERKMRAAVTKFTKSLAQIHQSVSWIWGESIIDSSVRLQILKRVLVSSNIQLIDDKILLDYIIRKTAT